LINEIPFRFPQGGATAPFSAEREKRMTGLELAKQLYESFDKDDIPGVLSCLADDIVWELNGSPALIPYFGTFRGKEEVRNFFARVFAAEEIIQFAAEQFIDGGDAVVVVGREHCRARATGREFKVRWAHVFDCRDGKIVRWREFIDTAPMAAAYQR
jgi:ketosteroid isomerase-like protein